MTHKETNLYSSRGVTLIELLVAMSVLAILLGIGVPSFSQFSTNNRLSNASNALFSSFSLARSEAIKRSSRVVVCKSADGLVCTGAGDWSQGWIVFSDLDNNGTKDGGEIIIQKNAAMPTGYSFTGNANVSNYVSYDTQGMTKLIGGGFQSGTFRLCPPDPAVVAGSGREIILSASGRARTVKVTDCV
ncbi:MAG: GspH/FimT family pseudopilin [Nitrosomonas sp.]|nr:GspH/FimT family pseudopilin [Nitrosomonas sp.]